MKHTIYIAVVLLFLAGCAKSGVVAAKFTLPEIGRASSAATFPEQRIYFPFASDSILQEAGNAITQNVEWLNKNSGIYVILEGHCDEIGQSEYNMQLGDRRARAVKAYMIEHGIPSERIITVVSYGSERPLNPGHRVEDLRDNRRVEFVVR